MDLRPNSYAITTATFQRRALFTQTANAELLLEIIFRYRNQGRFALHGFAIMPEHIHLLITPASGQSVERCAQCVKGGFSFAVREQFRGEVWQPGFHEHRIRDAEDFQNQLNYIARNPEKRNLNGYPFVHTQWLDRLDESPNYLRA
jgi:putative transposase